MSTIVFDPQCDDAERRRLLFAGALVVCSPRPSTLALCTFLRALVETVFAPLDPRVAQHSLPVQDFLDRLTTVKLALEEPARPRHLLQEVLSDLGCDLDRTYVSSPHLRHPPSDNYLGRHSGALPPHRDTWYACPFCQVNWWLPVYDIAADNCLAFYPRYWDRPIANGSGEYNPYADGAVRLRPTVKQSLAGESDLRVVCPAGSIIQFSAAHLHATVPNRSGVTRFSFEFRTVHGDDLAGARGAPNLDTSWTANILRRYARGRDFAPMPEELVALYDADVAARPREAQISYEGLVELLRRARGSADRRTAR